MRIYWSVWWWLLAFGLSAQEAGPELKFSLLRQNDEITPAGEAYDPSPYEHLKLMSLANGTTLSLGGSWRFQTEGFINQLFSPDSGADDLWFLNRLMSHGHLKVRDKFEVFGELNASLIASKHPLSPVDRDRLAVNQLFARYAPSRHWALTLGRQNVRLGSGRLVDVREGPNVRLSFDMAEVNFTGRSVDARLFLAVPVQQREGYFDNDYLRFTEYLAGLYVTRMSTEANGIDAYLLFKREDGKAWSAGTADDERFSLGARFFGERGKFSYNNEFVVQWGSFGEDAVRAWTASFDVGYSFDVGAQPYTLGLKTEAISGDRSPTDGRLNTFDGLYPRGAYFGRVALIGPANLLDVHPYLTTSRKRWSLMLDYVAFWRYSIRDGSYGPPLNLQFPDTNDARFVGHQFGTVTGFTVSRHLGLEGEGNVVRPGIFLAEGTYADWLFHTVLTLEVKL